MARSKSDISNSAIRIFLQMVGRFYDEERGYSKFVPNKRQKEELLEFFDHQCCFCGRLIAVDSLSQDHLIPMNKEHLGLHAWGNVVPCCKDCNNDKQHSGWRKFLATQAKGNTLAARRAKIEEFVESRRYDPNLHLHDYAGNLYEDVGSVAMTLIQLRYKQAEDAIRQLLAADEDENDHPEQGGAGQPATRSEYE